MAARADGKRHHLRAAQLHVERLERQRMRLRRLGMLKALTEMRELNDIDKFVTALRAIKSDGWLELERSRRPARAGDGTGRCAGGAMPSCVEEPVP